MEIEGRLVIKIDVEGYELFALRGAEEILKSNRPIVFCEILRKWSRKAGVDINAVLFYMRELGFVAHVAGSSGEIFEPVEVIDDATTNTNFFFSRDSILP